DNLHRRASTRIGQLSGHSRVLGPRVAQPSTLAERDRLSRAPAAMIALLVGIGVMLSALVVQGMTVVLAVQAISALLARRAVGIDVWRNGLATLLLIMILLTGHLAQMAVWAAGFMVTGEFETFEVAFYHSAVNYTTLGYGDIVMSEDW